MPTTPKQIAEAYYFLSIRQNLIDTSKYVQESGKEWVLLTFEVEGGQGRQIEIAAEDALRFYADTIQRMEHALTELGVDYASQE